MLNPAIQSRRSGGKKKQETRDKKQVTRNKLAAAAVADLSDNAQPYFPFSTLVKEKNRKNMTLLPYGLVRKTVLRIPQSPK